MYKNVALNKEKVEKFFEEGVGFGITYHGENSEGRCVISAKFKHSEIEKEKNKLIEGKFNDNLKEVFRHYQFRTDGVSYSTEKITDEGIFKENYHEFRSERGRKRIIEQNKKNREQEQIQTENPPSFDREDQPAEKVNSQPQKLENNDNKNIYYGVGAISLVLVVVSMITV